MNSSLHRKVPKGIHDSCRILLQWQIKYFKKISSKDKINSVCYQQNILQTIFETKEITDLYGKDIYKVEIHMIKASSHTSKSSAAYLRKTPTTTTENRNWNKVCLII